MPDNIYMQFILWIMGMLFVGAILMKLAEFFIDYMMQRLRIKRIQLEIDLAARDGKLRETMEEALNDAEDGSQSRRTVCG